MTRYLIKMTMVTATQLHIGSGRRNDLSDSLLFRRADGQLVLPGTSLAGALRSRATHLFPALTNGHQCNAARFPNRKEVCGCPVCRLFGDLYTDSKASARLSSRLRVHDSLISADASIAIRDGVGLGRDSRAAADAIKFDYETLPAGTRFVLQLEADLEDELQQQLLAALLAEVGEGRVLFGGKSARGLGRVALEKVEARPVPPFSAGTLAGWMDLLRQDDWFTGADFTTDWYEQRLEEARQLADRADLPTHIHLDAELRFTDAFLTRDSFLAVASRFDSMPLLSGGGAQRRTFLSGSAIRGALRFHSERILRTLAADYAIDPWLAACDPLIDKDKGKSVCHSDPDRQCLACKLFGSTERGSRLTIADAPQVGDVLMFVQDYLAIDRFTGGGADRKKFDAVACWEPTYRLQLALEDPLDWEIGLLLLALRDLNDGLFGFGSGRAKGMGIARLHDDATMTWIGRGAEAIPGEQTWSGALPARKVSLKDLMETDDIQKTVEALQSETKNLPERSAASD